MASCHLYVPLAHAACEQHNNKFQNSLVLPVQTKAAQAELRAWSKHAPRHAQPPTPPYPKPQGAWHKGLCREVFATNASVHIMLPAASTPQTDGPRTGRDVSECYIYIPHFSSFRSTLVTHQETHLTRLLPDSSNS